jgi:hypothetical protein
MNTSLSPQTVAAIAKVLEAPAILISPWMAAVGLAILALLFSGYWLNDARRRIGVGFLFGVVGFVGVVGCNRHLPQRTAAMAYVLDTDFVISQVSRGMLDSEIQLEVSAPHVTRPAFLLGRNVKIAYDPVKVKADLQELKDLTKELQFVNAPLAKKVAEALESGGSDGSNDGARP